MTVQAAPVNSPRPTTNKDQGMINRDTLGQGPARPANTAPAKPKTKEEVIADNLSRHENNSNAYGGLPVRCGPS